MRVGCIICSDTFSNFTDVSSAACGHTFHTHCLLQWLENSKSCPICRHKATPRNALKLYFEAISNDSVSYDPDSLQTQIESLKFQVVEKTQLLKNIQEKILEEEEISKRLREECTKLEALNKKLKGSNINFKDTISYLKSSLDSHLKYKQQAEEAVNRLKLLKHIELLVKDNALDIEETIFSNSSRSENLQENLKNLATIVSVLKSRVSQLMVEKKSVLNQLKNIEHQYTEEEKLRKHSQKDLVNLKEELNMAKCDLSMIENEKCTLKEKISKLQESIISPSGDVKNSVIRRLITEDPPPNFNFNNVTPDCASTSRRAFSKENFKNRAINLNESPLKLKRKISSQDSKSSKAFNIFDQNVHALRPPLHSIHNGKPLQDTSSSKPLPNVKIGYDGLGGHHRVDEFKKPLKFNQKSPQKSPTFNHKSPRKIVFKTNRSIGSKKNTQVKISSKSIKNFFSDPFS